MKLILPLLLLCVLMISCAPTGGGGGNGTSGSTSANGSSAIAAAIASGFSAQASNQSLSQVPSLPSRLEFFLGITKSAQASGNCPTSDAPFGVPCGGAGNQTLTLTYSGCSFPSGLSTWTGSETLKFGGTAICGTTNLPLVNNGDTLTRQFVGTIAAGTAMTRTSTEGFSVKFDSATPSGYASSVSGGAVILGNGSGHTITIAGARLLSSSWDFTASTGGGLPLTVVTPGAKRIIQSGTILLQNNSAKYTASSTFSSVGFTATSCFPQSGSITTTFTGSVTGTETLTFNGNGNATLQTTGGTSVQFPMVHCF